MTLTKEQKLTSCYDLGITVSDLRDKLKIGTYAVQLSPDYDTNPNALNTFQVLFDPSKFVFASAPVD